MAEVIENTSQLPWQDLQAMATYLNHIPAIDAPAPGMPEPNRTEEVVMLDTAVDNRPSLLTSDPKEISEGDEVYVAGTKSLYTTSDLEPIERLDGPDTKYPLSIASNHPRGQLHSQLCGTEFRNTYAVQNREPCWINPRDAKDRDIKDGDVVRVFNDRGQILAGVVVTDDIMPGVIRVSEGGWFDPLDPREIGSLCCYGDVNNLTPGIATSKLAQANCGQTGVGDVEKFDGELPEVLVFSQPEIRKDSSATG